MTAWQLLVDLLGQDVIVTNPQLGTVMGRGKLVALVDQPTVIIEGPDGQQISLPQDFRVEPDVTTDARRVIAELKKYEDEHGHHNDGWPCLAKALDAARDAVQP